MDKGFQTREYLESDLKDMITIFNQFARTSSAVYCDSELTIDQFKKLLEPTVKILILQSGNRVIGFGYLSKYKPFPNFNHTAILTYFIKPGFTGTGLGTEMLDRLLEFGKEQRITNYLAHISSKNIQSLNFHKKHGFDEVGRFKNVRSKFGEYFDVVWVQKQFS